MTSLLASKTAPFFGWYVVAATFVLAIFVGASFAEIGQLLRHRSIDSTRIYAKLDIEKLRELSLPWPGGVQ